MADAGAPADSDPRLWSYTAVSGEECKLVPILQCGELYSYNIPSFSSNYGGNEKDQVPDRPP